MRSIWQKPKIQVGDLVIGRPKYKWEGSLQENNRSFVIPSMVVEINQESALVFIEKVGPTWYNIDDLEKVYAKEPKEEQGQQ